MNKILPRIGNVYGKYTIISDEIKRNRDKKMRVKVKCSCGNEKWLDFYYLRTYFNPRCSSCTKKETSKRAIETRRKNGNLHKGIGSLNKTFISTIKNSAIRRGYKWNCNIEELYQLFLNQDEKCALSGVEISFCEDLKNGKYDFKKASASLDRIDSSKDYDINNLQWVHKDINKMKNIFEQEYFIKMCKYVAKKN